jgi:puromycin-sensitive aminopeptidase
MTTNGSTEEFRLPGNVRPRRYELTLRPDLESATFTGVERIEIEVTEHIDAIVLNANELVLTDAALGPVRDGEGSGPASGEETLPLGIELDAEHEMAVLRPGGSIAPGRYSLTCRFEGTLNDKLCGFYRSRFVDESGTERTIATTQFEETDARRAFPCFDEPAYKAVFSVTLEVAEELLAISNGPEISREEIGEQMVRIRFGDTVPMSTYLVAFVVGPLVATEPVDVDGVALRVVHVPGKEHLTAAAIDSATHALRFFTEYFALPYPGEKCDLVAVPDFAAGAMENLGCVTFREAILLADPDDTSRTELQRLAEVVEHELAHMWFGDLVTMGWWNGIWLNEAFATFMALCCQDDYRPEWETFVAFSRSKAAAFSVDGLHATRPIEYPVVHPDDAAAMFDVLTYEKGASVLWMLEAYLGRDTFRAGVRRYLAEHQFANTETTDLWDAIEAEAHQPVRELMDGWIFQGGYPLVRASLSDGELSVTAEPFSYLDQREAPEGESAIGRDWIVPVISRPLAGGAERRDLVGPDGLRFASGPAVLNAGATGFYRVAYDEALAAELASHLEALSPGERYALVADTWSVAVAGRGPAEAFFSLVGRLGAERDPNVYSVVTGALSLLDLVVEESRRADVAALARRLLHPVLDDIGFLPTGPEDEQRPLLRSGLVAALGTFGEDDEVLARCRELFDADHRGGRPLPADLASAVLAAVAYHLTPAEFEAIADRVARPDSPLDEVRHVNALGLVRDPALVAKVHEMCRVELRSQNAPYVLASLLRSRDTSEATFRYIAAHFTELTQRFPDNSMHRMLDGMSGLTATDGRGRPLHLAELRAFIDRNISGPRRRLVMQSLERLLVNLAFGRSVRGRIDALVGAVGDV